MNFYFIYKIRLLNTQKDYIGYTNDLNRRLYDHIKALDEGVHPNKCLQDDYVQDKVSIEILEADVDVEQSYIQEREKYWIGFYHSFENGYNQTPGGEGNLTFRNFQQDNVLEAFAILHRFPNESSMVVQEIFNMSESSVLRLKNKKTYLSTIAIFERMSLDKQEDFLQKLEIKYNLQQRFKKHRENVIYKNRALSERDVLMILVVGKNIPKQGAKMEKKLGLASSHSSRIIRGLRYKEYQDVYNNLTEEEKEKLLKEAKIFFDIK